MPHSRLSSSMQIRVFADERAVADALAVIVVSAVRDAPRSVLGLPTGRTPVLLYNELVQRSRAGTLDLSHVTTFNLDEFLGLPATHPGSYRHFMEHHLFGHLGERRPHAHILDGTAADPEAECARYEAAIAEAGGIDLQILGLGTNGHIGFNEPAPELAARTHRVDAAARDAPIERGPVRRRPRGRAAGGAVDGDGHDSPGEAHRSDRNGGFEGGLRPQDDRGAADDDAACVVPAAAQPRRGDARRSRRRGI